MDFSFVLFIVIVFRCGCIVAHDHEPPLNTRYNLKQFPEDRDVYDKKDYDRHFIRDGSSQLGKTTSRNTTDTTAIVRQNVDIAGNTAESSTEIVLMVQGEQSEKPATISMTRIATDIDRTMNRANVHNLRSETSSEVRRQVIIRNQLPVGVFDSGKASFRQTRGVKLDANDMIRDSALKIDDLRVLHVTDTTVELAWQTVPPYPDAVLELIYWIKIETTRMSGCGERKVKLPDDICEKSSARTIQIKNLHPYSDYTATVLANGTGNITLRAGNKFRTTATDIPTSVVSKLRYDARENILRWAEPNDCTTITGPIWGTRLSFYSVGSNEPEVTEQTASTFLNLSNIPLRANAAYNVHAHVIRDDKKFIFSIQDYAKVEFQTPSTEIAGSAKVIDLEIVSGDSDTSTIILRWKLMGNEIDNYKLLIRRNDILLREQPIRISANKEKKYNVTLPLNLEKTNIELQVLAVDRDGRSQTSAEKPILFDPVKWFKRPSRPLNLHGDSDSRGIVMLKWNHPSVSYIPIRQFDIQIEVLETKLLDFQAKKIRSMNVTCPVKETRPNYLECLYLQTSTSYRISVTALNSKKLRSSQAQVDVSVPAGCAFWNGDALRLTPNGASFDVEVPGVENATKNTMVTIFVEGYTKCATTQLSSRQFGLRKWAVHEYQLETSKSRTSTIDPDHGAGPNCSLRREEAYNITAVLRDELGKLDELTSSWLTISHKKRHNWMWAISIPILAICLLLVVIWQLKRRKIVHRTRLPSFLEIIPNSPTTTIHFNNLTPRHSTHMSAMLNEADSCAVDIQHFEAYAKSVTASGLLYSQFMLLPRGMTKPCVTGMLPENIPKNRYRNLIAYDDTRVVLNKIPGDPHSDYINASYIRGYHKERAYIATQGPKPNTINDFWRMIWQEDVRVICMMSNILEGVTKHSEKYWPDSGTRTKYGNFFISNTNQQVFADFTFRTFQLSCYRESREVTHLQFTGWPVLGMPSTQSFVAYFKKLVQTPSDDGPIVVHCHAGDGRSGIIILCDISLRQAIGESTIDVMAITTRMRDSRANMVATPQQYLFAHIAIVESLMSIPTQLPCAEVCTDRLQKKRLQLMADLQRLEDTMWQEQALDAFATQASPTTKYTTIDHIAPDISVVADSDRSETFDRRGSGVEVVSVDGLRLKNQYLTSWLPPPLTLANFWKFVAEKNIQIIIILQCSDPKTPTCSDIIPDQLIRPSMPHMTVELKSFPEKSEYFTSEKLLLWDTSERITRSRTVTVLTCGGWQTGEYGKPPAPVALVSLWRASEKIPRKEAETLVLCNNGSSGCGLYLSMCLLLERMAVEGECDVISAVRRVRKSNPAFVLSKNHCEYLYDAAEVYAEYFKCYANFV